MNTVQKEAVELAKSFNSTIEHLTPGVPMNPFLVRDLDKIAKDTTRVLNSLGIEASLVQEEGWMFQTIRYVTTTR